MAEQNPRSLLFITQILPYPLDAGPKIRAYYVLRFLSQRYAVTLLSFIRATDTLEAVDHLRSFCEKVVTVPITRSRFRDGWAVIRSLFTNEPFLIARDRVPEMSEFLAKLIHENHFHTIHADQLWMAPYALQGRFLAQSLGYKPRLVLDQHNAVFQIPRRMALDTRNVFLKLALRRETIWMARYEAYLCRQFDHVIWVTEEDLAAVEKYIDQDGKGARNSLNSPISESNNRIIPICMDPSIVKLAPLHPDTSGILFLGGMHWPPNAEGARWFVQDILPLILAVFPQAIFYAIGKSPPLEISSINAVVAPGYVDDPQVFWKHSRVFVVPLRAGGGMRVKILDAWARGMPVVSTTIGAEGITYQDGENILIADTPQAFAEAIMRLLMDEDLASQIGRNGRAAMEKNYNWRTKYKAWDEVYD